MKKKTNNLTDFSKVKIIEETRNISEWNIVDGFKCEKCGTEIIDYSRREVDEYTGEVYEWEYTPKYCPECGRKVVDE
ncbi:MAG: hypothetical protein K6G88_05740 [Lachnospiraceae bacterium]|nr:hypothetical protein [Lachnospiraceae bacterium]